MDNNYIAYISYLGGGITFTALTLAFAYCCKQKYCHFSLIIAAATSALWHLAIAGNYQFYSLSRESLLLLEILRYGAWIHALLSSLKFSSQQALPTIIRLGIYGTWFASLSVVLGLIGTGHEWVQDSNLLIWNSLILSIISLISVEQLYRNTSDNRLIKLISVSFGALVIYDLYLFSSSLILDHIDQGLWYSRGAVNTTAALLLTLGAVKFARNSEHRAGLSISRPVVFYTASMSAAGFFLALMALGGYYVQLYGGLWGNVVKILALFSTLLGIAVLFASRRIRAAVSVWINKNFFQHKYDYRAEWLNLINSLSQPTLNDNFHERAIKVVASVFKSQGGCLWLKKNGFFIPTHTYNMATPETEMIVAVDSPFSKTMREQEWVFSPLAEGHQELTSANHQLPDWVYQIPNVWLVLPLLTEKNLLGFIILVEPKYDTQLTWEDLDLLKTVGRQVASYLDRHEAAEFMAQSKQFDAFNKLTAFIMHDLKNLIAQQALVVHNAAKHKDNPAFVEDMVNTIDNSVARMNNLLRKLQQQESSEVKSLTVTKVLIEAAKKCHENNPQPSLRLNDQGLMVDADQDLLIMSLANLIKNAQEATDDNGFVDVTLRREDKNAIITVDDNGSGMDAEFIRNRLFKPFDTTKSGKGMGIGVYQTREYIKSLGGEVEVESTINEGTSFTISIPASAV